MHHRRNIQFREEKHVRYNIGKKCKNYPMKVRGAVVLFIICVTLAHLIFSILEVCLMRRKLANELIQCEGKVQK